MRSRLAFVLGMIGLSLTMFSAPARSCQVVCVIYGTSSTRGVLIDNGDHGWPSLPIAKAKIVVRDASPFATGPEVYCARKGPVVLTTSTDKHGNFNLKGIHPGKYFITYMDAQKGQSFLVEIGPSEGSNKRLRLSLFSPGGECYAVDVERNVTIPDWGGLSPSKITIERARVPKY